MLQVSRSASARHLARSLRADCEHSSVAASGDEHSFRNSSSETAGSRPHAFWTSSSSSQASETSASASEAHPDISAMTSSLRIVYIRRSPARTRPLSRSPHPTRPRTPGFLPAPSSKFAVFPIRSDSLDQHRAGRSCGKRESNLTILRDPDCRSGENRSMKHTKSNRRRKSRTSFSGSCESAPPTQHCGQTTPRSRRRLSRRCFRTSRPSRSGPAFACQRSSAACIGRLGTVGSGPATESWGWTVGSRMT